MAGKVWWQKYEMPGHIESTVRKQKEIDASVALPMTCYHPTFRVWLPTSTNTTYKLPHRHVHRLVPKMFLDPVKLTISVGNHIKTRSRPRSHTGLSEVEASSHKGHAVLQHQNLPSRSRQRTMATSQGDCAVGKRNWTLRNF